MFVGVYWIVSRGWYCVDAMGCALGDGWEVDG